MIVNGSDVGRSGKDDAPFALVVGKALAAFAALIVGTGLLVVAVVLVIRLLVVGVEAAWGVL